MTCSPYWHRPLPAALWVLLLLPLLLAVALIGSTILAVWLASEIIVLLWLSLSSAVSSRLKRLLGRTRRFPSTTNAGGPER